MYSCGAMARYSANLAALKVRGVPGQHEHRLDRRGSERRRLRAKSPQVGQAGGMGSIRL